MVRFCPFSLPWTQTPFSGKANLIPIFFDMVNSYNLPSSGWTNRRLHRLVCDKPVWRNLLNGIDNFTKERLDELVKFVGDKGSSGLKTEVLKEVASRFRIYPGADDYSCGKKGGWCGEKCLFKVTVSMGGWGGAPATFAMGESQLVELHSVAEAVQAEFTIKEVKTFQHLRCDMKTIKLIRGLVEQQGDGLAKLELQHVMLSNFQQFQEQDVFWYLVESSKEWKVHDLSINLTSWLEESPWTRLARSATTGHIGTLQFLIHQGKMEKASKEEVKSVWEMAEQVVAYPFANQRVVIRGGRVQDSKTTWEEAYQTLLKYIC